MIDRFKTILSTTVFKNSAWLFVLQVFNTILPLVTIPYVARILGAAGYGNFSLSLNWITYFQVIVEYGFAYSGARKVSIYDEGELQDLYSRIISARIVLLTASFAILLLVCFVFEVNMQQIICMAILFIMIMGVAFQLTWLFQGKQEMKVVTIINAGARLLSVIATFGLVHSVKDIYLYCICYSSTFVFSAFAGIFYAKKRYGLEIRLCRLREALDEIKDGWYLFTSQAMSKLFSGIGVTILGNVAPASIVGIYSAIYKIPYVLILFFGPVSQSLYPYISQRYLKSFKAGLTCIKKTIGYVLPLYAVAAVIVTLFRKYIIYYAFGMEYVCYSIIIIPLLIWVILSVLNNFLGIQCLVASGHQKEYSQSFLVGAVVMAVLNITMGYKWDIYGISLAAPIGEAVLTILLLQKLRKLEGILINQENVNYEKNNGCVWYSTGSDKDVPFS